MTTIRTLRSSLDNAERLWADRAFVFTRMGAEFAGKTFGEFAADVRALSVELIKRGLAGKNLLICGENSYEWLVADLALSGFVGVSAVISKDLKPADWRAAIENTDIAAVFYSKSLADEFAGLKSLFDIPFFSLQRDLHTLIASGKETQTAGMSALFPECDVTALCKIIFTSGTTAPPKAVMLSQKNIFAGVRSLYARAPMNETDSSYLFAPLSHTYGGIYNFVYCLLYGMELYLCSDISLMAEELRRIRPTIFCAVPRVLERFLAVAQAGAAPAETLRQIFGGRLRYLFCGGGPWRSEDRAFYLDSGLNLLEAYALTETASSLSIAYSGEGDAESAGVVFENIEVRIDNPDSNGFGEILTRGDHVFLGYYNDEEATKVAIDEAGFFHTGDIGRMDGARRLYLKGRKGRLFKTSAGEFVSPERIEALLLARQGVQAVSVFNDGGCAAAVLELSDASLDIAAILDEVNRELPTFMRVKKYSVQGASEDNKSVGWKSLI